MKPEWWPENPYFESAMGIIKSDADYAEAIPDPSLRTAISWYLGNRFWNLASDMIFEALQNHFEEVGEVLLTGRSDFDEMEQPETIEYGSISHI